MKVEYIKKNYRFETLNKNHDLSDFKSESDELNDFIKNDALNQQIDKLNLTKLVICDDEIIGFVTLLTDTIEIKKIRDDFAKENIKNHLNTENREVSKSTLLPAIKIGCFAIAEKYSKQGLGTIIFRNIMYNLKLMSENNIGFRFVVVEGYARAYKLYVYHNKFVHLKKDDKEIEKNLEKIIKRDPEKTFYLYRDLKI